MRFLSSLRMQHRITISVVLGLAIILGIFAYLAISAVNDSRDAAKNERLTWARATAAHVDDVLRRAAERTGLVAGALSGDWGGPGFDPAVAAASYADSLPGSDVAIYSTDGTPIWAEANGRAIRYPESLAQQAVQRSQTMMEPCSDGAMLTLCVASPIEGSSGEPLALLVRRLDLSDPALELLLPPDVGESAHAELLNPDARIVAADVAQMLGSSVHAPAVGDFVDSSAAGVRIHDPAGEGDKHIVAYAPIDTVPGWGIVVEQTTDVALAAADDLQRRIILFGILALALAAGLAWFDVRQVVRPLRVLTSRAEKMASGDLDTPISSSRQDEVGILTNTFESMRAQLKDSLEEIRRRDRELEQRVQERTQEVRELYEELRRKEEARGRLLEKVISAQEEERRRIARELHDETGQSLTGVVMSLEAGADSLEREPTVARQRLQRAKALAGQSIEAIRRLVVNLRPAGLDEAGLVPALRAYAEGRLAEEGVELDFDVAGLRDRLLPEVETCLFRVAQEAITNIVRHADARHARIRLQRQDGEVTLVVEDDGRGFDPVSVGSSRDQGRGLGLLGMEERVSLLGGQLTVESAPGRGTRVLATISVDGGEPRS